MIAPVGLVILALALLASLCATVAAWLGALRGDGRWIARGRRGTAVVAALLASEVALLVAALVADRFELVYVTGHSAREMPLHLKVSALWAGQEGSLLLWAALQAASAAWFAARPSGGRGSDLVPWATALLGVVTTFFAGLCLLAANPFVSHLVPPPDGVGLNPLLRHPAMVLHPPILYVGYVGLAVPAALALAALIVGEADAFPRAARPWALGAWLTLGAGLLLGARWAYDVLGWGGYWGWDPVENAGLMPWLTATGLLHALRPSRGRGADRVWAFALAVVSFLLVILGTFITRGGVVASVHAFALSSVGPPLLAFLGVAALGSLALLLTRAGLFAPADPATEDPDGAVLSREGIHALTLVLLSTLTASVLLGTLLPTLTEALGMRRLAAGPEWFDRVTGPQFAGLVLLMGLCPLAGYVVGGVRRVGGILPALLGGVALPALVAAAGVGGGLTLAAMALVGAAGGATLAALALEAVAARGSTGVSLATAAWRALGRHRRRFAGYLAHVGVLVMAIGIVATRQHTYDATLVLPRGERASVRGYELALEDLGQVEAGDHTTTRASVAVYRGGDLRARLYPRLDRYPGSAQVVVTPAVRARMREDLYLVLAGWTDGGAAATFRVVVNPLVSLIWAGGAMLLFGGAVALWPRRATAVARPMAGGRP